MKNIRINCIVLAKAHKNRYFFNSDFQTCNRNKIKDYFAANSTKDFKNSKKFWQFYSSSIKIKSDKTNEDFLALTSLDNGSVISQDPAEFGMIFNSFFTNLSSTSTSNTFECESYVNSTFTESLKRMVNFLKRRIHISLFSLQLKQ